MSLFIAVLAALVALTAGQTEKPLIIAHRGTPCRFPEETVHGYEYAVELGVDYIEMDVVAARDGVLLTRHDLILDLTSNVADLPKFRGRSSTKPVPLQGDISGFFAIDFTLDEIKELRARQAFPFRDHSFDDQFQIPTLLEVLEVIKDARENGRQVGAYIETKDPEFHRMHDIFLEELLIEDLKKSGLLHDPGAIYLQSFSLESLQTLHTELLKDDVTLPATWLLDCVPPFPTSDQLLNFSRIGTAIGPSKLSLAKLDEFAPECGRAADAHCYDVTPGQTCEGRLEFTPKGAPILDPLISNARAAGLEIHAYTFRNEERYMALDFLSDPVQELRFYTGQGAGVLADGVFLDCAESALQFYQSLPQPSFHSSSTSNAGWIVAVVLLGIGWTGTVGIYFYLRLRSEAETRRFMELAVEAPDHEPQSVRVE